MAIQYINTGSSANAGNGDSLRSAFVKVNNNFAYLSTSTFGGGNGYTGSQGVVGFTGSRGFAGFAGSQGAVGFTGSAATNDFGSQGQLGFYRSTGTTVSPVPGFSYNTVTSTLLIGDSVNRSTNLLWTRETYSPTARGWTFSQHYDSQDVLDFTWYRTRGTSASQTVLNANDDIADFAFTTWNGTQTSESAAITVRVESTSTSNPASKFMFFTNDGFRRFPVLASELSSTGTFRFFKIGSLSTSTSIKVQTNLEPDSDLTYDLGSTSNQWRSLYVSSSTIYIGRKALSIDANNNITINGEIATGGYTGSQGDRGFTGSRGNAGSTGEAGATGFTGSRGNLGFTGSRGDTGFVGSQGDIGYAGSRGNLGFTGSRGDTGYDGSQGDIGYTGSEGTPGQQGNRGYTGSEGAQGTPGLQGNTGAQGVSIVLVGSTDTVTTSTVGLGNAGQGWINTTDGDVYFWNTLTTNWENIGPIVGPQGDLGYTGSRGSQGDIGLTGDLGYTGSRGDRGYDGSRGDVGYAGSQGELGYVGSQGDLGYVGSQGDIGYTGSQGELGYVGSQGDIGYVGSAGPQGEPGSDLYTPTTPTDWNGSLTVATFTAGLDELASRTVTLEDNKDRITSGSYSVVLGSDGNLTLPSQGKIMPTGYVNSFLTFNYGDDVELKAGDNLYLSGSVATIRTNGAVIGQINATSVNVVSSGTNYIGNSTYATDYPGTLVFIPSGPGPLVSGNFVVQSTEIFTVGDIITIPASIQGNTTATIEVTSTLPYSWAFANTGQLNLPQASNGTARIQSTADIDILSGNSLWTFDVDGVLTLPNGLTIDGAPGFEGIQIGGTSTWISVNNEGAPPGFIIATDVGGAEHRWLFEDTGTLLAPGHLIPNADLAYDLGSTTTQWRSLYVGTGTIYIGGIELGVNRSEQVTVNGNPIITVSTGGNLTVQGGDTIIGSVLVSDTAPPASTEGALWFNTVEARNYIVYNGQWVDASPTVLDPNTVRTNEDNDVEFPNDAIFLDGRIYQNAAGGITSMRWINMTSGDSMLRAYRGNNQNEIGQLGVDYQDANTSGMYVAGYENGSQRRWTFEGNGGIRFPDNTVQTTAWQGTNTFVGGGGASTWLTPD